VQQRIGDYYSSCMDEAAINTKGIAVLKPELDRINGLQSKRDLAGEIAHLHEITFALDESTDSGATTAVFGFGSQQDFDDASKVVASADQGGLGLPDRDYYLKNDAESTDTRKQYQAHVQKMLELMGEAPAQANADAKVVMDMETALAKSSMDLVKRRDPANLNHKLTGEQLRALAPSFLWDDYLKPIGVPSTAHYLVLTPDFYKALDQLITSQSLDNWKTYLRWHLVHDSASILGEPFVQENFNFYGQRLLGQKQIRPRWRRCVSYVDRDLGEALGQAYVERAFGPESKQRMLKMVHALETALGRDIEQLDWMTPATKKEAIAKLKKIEDKIGYPNKWRDYSRLNIANWQRSAGP
jgi:putative endopeptidase